MAESKSNGSGGALIFAAGTLFGAFLVFLVLKGREQPAPAAAQQPQALMMPSFMPQYVDMSAELQRLHAELYRLRQENAGLRAQMQIAIPQGPVVTTTPHAPVPTPAQITAAPKETKTVQAIQNEEEWIIKKDRRGRLEGITVHRKVVPVG